MKHYVLNNDPSLFLKAGSDGKSRVRFVDVIFRNPPGDQSAEVVQDFFQALNQLVEGHQYVLTPRFVGDEIPSDPTYWAGRAAIFWGDIYVRWASEGHEKTWISQVINLSPRTVLVGGAVLLLAQFERRDGALAAIHPNFAAVAQELGLGHSGSNTHLSPRGRIHSATTRLSAIQLLADLAEADHGAFLAQNLRGYIGLSEPQQSCESSLANRLIQRAGADPVVQRTIAKMLETIEHPMPITDLSNALGLSTRQLQRRFLNKTKAKLLTTYRALRIERAHSFLCHTDMSFQEIAVATGFSSSAAMSRAFRDQYKTTLESVRKRRFLGESDSKMHEMCLGSCSL